MIEVRNATKRYQTVTAVDDVSFAVSPGEILGLLGPNGAGKTSLIRMIVGLTRPDSGTIRVSVRGRAAARSDLGYLPEERGLHKGVPILRTLTFYGALQGIPGREARARAQAWLHRLGLAERSREKVDALSKGNQQKVQLAASLIHEPHIAILDEPFAGLDPINLCPSCLQILGLIPATSMTVVPARVVLGDVSTLYIATSLGLLGAATWCIRRTAARIYEAGMLMYGKEPSLREMLRWARSRPRAT